MKRKLKTKSKVQTVTNVQIFTATFALLLANGFALALMPIKYNFKLPPVNCSVRLQKSYFCELKKGVGGYKDFTATCPNGKTVQISGACRTEESVREMAVKICKEKKMCVVAKAETGSPALKLTPKALGNLAPKLLDNADIAFVGRPDQFVTFYDTGDSIPRVKVQFMNRGPAVLPRSLDVSGGTKMVLTLLDGTQAPANVANAVRQTELPALLSNSSAELSFAFDRLLSYNLSSNKVKFLKIEILVGDRKVGDLGVFDPDLSNNTIIVEIPTTFPLQK